jgi:hypothetical protein
MVKPDDRTLGVVDGSVEVISQRRWMQLGDE